VHSLRAALILSPRFRRAVGLVGLLCVVIATVFFQARAASNRPITVTALFTIEPKIPTATDARDLPRPATFGFETFTTSQLGLLKCTPFLNDAFRTSNLQSLTLLQNVKDPAAWLAKHVRFYCPSDGVLAISMSGPNFQKGDLTEIVDAIAKAYNEEFSNQKEMGPSVTYDAMVRTLDTLKSEIKRKRDEYEDIEREMGPPKPDDIDPFPNLDTHQLSAVAHRLQQVLADLGTSNDLHPQAELDELRAELKRYNDVIRRRSEGGYGLDARKRDLDQRQMVANDLEKKLESFDRYALNLFRVRQLQSATVAFDEP